MNKQYTIYLAVVTVVLAAISVWAFAITFADIGAFASSIFSNLAAIVSNNALQFSVFAIAFIFATAYYSFLTFGYLFAGKKRINERAGWFGHASCTTVAFILIVQGINAQVHQEPQQVAQWYANMKLFGIIMAFVGFAAAGRWFFPPKQKPKKDNTEDENNAPAGTGRRHGSGSL